MNIHAKEKSLQDFTNKCMFEWRWKATSLRDKGMMQILEAIHKVPEEVIHYMLQKYVLKCV